MAKNPFIQSYPKSSRKLRPRCVTSKSLDRSPIYARLGVPEIWCYDSGVLMIYLLEGDRYEVSEQSRVFPTLNIRALPQLIESQRSAGRLALRRAVRNWVREQSQGA